MQAQRKTEIVNINHIRIRLAKESDLRKYSEVLQRVYQNSYTDDKIGLIADCFSMEIFSASATQKYLSSNLKQSSSQRTWLAFADSKLIGSITITDRAEECKLRGFYVDLGLQNKGIGKKLLERALDFAKGKKISLDLYAHNHKTINIYKKWGFEIDKEKGVFYRHWPGWPKGLQAKCIYMKLESDKARELLKKIKLNEAETIRGSHGLDSVEVIRRMEGSRRNQ